MKAGRSFLMNTGITSGSLSMGGLSVDVVSLCALRGLYGWWLMVFDRSTTSETTIHSPGRLNKFEVIVISNYE